MTVAGTGVQVGPQCIWLQDLAAMALGSLLGKVGFQHGLL